MKPLLGLGSKLVFSIRDCLDFNLGKPLLKPGHLKSIAQIFKPSDKKARSAIMESNFFLSRIPQRAFLSVETFSCLCS